MINYFGVAHYVYMYGNAGNDFYGVYTNSYGIIDSPDTLGNGPIYIDASGIDYRHYNTFDSYGKESSPGLSIIDNAAFYTTQNGSFNGS